MLRRIFFILTVPLAAVITFAAPALAGNTQLKGNHPLSFTDNGLTLTSTVSYAGLGNFDTLQIVTATGNVTAACTNPAGATQPPGQNLAPVTLTGSAAGTRFDIKNGNLTISTVTGAPPTPIPGAPDCPSRTWTENITDVAFTSATIQLFEDSDGNGVFEIPGELVQTVIVTFSPATSNGPVLGSGFTFAITP